jgi:DNA-binding transcriptional MocR family regulator
MIDLRLNYPSVEVERALIEAALGSALAARNDALFTFPPYAGTWTDRGAAARWLASAERTVAPEDIFLCSGGNHAILVALLGAKLVARRLAAERFTYPAFKSIVSDLGGELVACEIDEEGLDPAALERAARERSVDAVYVQPTIHNPTCHLMSIARRREIVAVARTYDLLIIEDDAYRFLASGAPPRITDLAPERTIGIVSLSKPICPLLKLAYLVAPASFAREIESAIRLTSSGVSSVLAAAASSLIGKLAYSRLIEAKRTEAKRRQELLREAWSGVAYRTHPTSFHVWVELPPNRESHSVIRAAERAGVALSGGIDFALNAEDGLRFLRVSLGGESDDERLIAGLRTVQRVVAS